ncbi:unnamed protein product [Cladocopium goreaui]|uniref:Uncharacterized protein n=1 Tax=Cladocopium goreaui TaxID=2562237 RepID=A0A9P1FN46_9DINO|nr:unnamed protein product [Cladocopium goreaui]
MVIADHQLSAIHELEPATEQPLCEAWNDDSPPPPPPRPPRRTLTGSCGGFWDKFRCSFASDARVNSEEETGVQSFTSRTEIAPESSPDSTVGSDARSVRSNGRLGLADRVVRKHQKNYLQARLHVVTFLESNGFKEIDVNCKKSKSFGLIRTYPLHEATKQENAYVVFWLLYLGADPFLKDSSGRTAIDYVNPLTTDPQVIRVFQNLHIQRQFQRIWPPPGLDDLLLERQIDPLANSDGR